MKLAWLVGIFSYSHSVSRSHGYGIALFTVSLVFASIALGAHEQ